MQFFNMLNNLHKNDTIIFDFHDQVAFLRHKINFSSHFIFFKLHHIYNIVLKFITIIFSRHLHEEEFQLFKITLLNYRDKVTIKKIIKKN